MGYQLGQFHEEHQKINERPFHRIFTHNFSLLVIFSNDELLIENPSYNETLSSRIECFSRQRTDRVLFWGFGDQFCY